MMNLQRCYELLELSPPISQTDLRQAYKDLVQVWHPDRFSHNPRLQQKAEEKLKQINTAYEVLDQFLQQQSQLPATVARSSPPPPADWPPQPSDPYTARSQARSQARYDARSSPFASRKTILEQLSFRTRIQLYGFAIVMGVLFLLWSPILLLYWMSTHPQVLIRLLLIVAIVSGIYYGLRQLSEHQAKQQSKRD